MHNADNVGVCGPSEVNYVAIDIDSLSPESAAAAFEALDNDYKDAAMEVATGNTEGYIITEHLFFVITSYGWNDNPSIPFLNKHQSKLPLHILIGLTLYNRSLGLKESVFVSPIMQSIRYTGLIMS